jgi:hypothetical protein
MRDEAAGSRAARRRARCAYVVGVFDPTYAQPLEVVAHRLVELRSVFPLYAMATANAIAAAAEVVGRSFVVRVEPIAPPALAHTAGRFSRMYTKLRQWSAFASTHDRIVSLDADLLPLRNLDHLFGLALPPAGVLAVPDQTVCAAHPNAFNGGGPYVLRPSVATFSTLLAVAAAPSLPSNGRRCQCDSDQEVLNAAFQPCRHSRPSLANVTTASQLVRTRGCVRFLPLEYALYQEQCGCSQTQDRLTSSPPVLQTPSGPTTPMSMHVPSMDLERIYTLHMICKGYGKPWQFLSNSQPLTFEPTAALARECSLPLLNRSERAIPTAAVVLLRRHEERNPQRKACCGATTRLWLAAYSCSRLSRLDAGP